jgi:hypothetical protein
MLHSVEFTINSGRPIDGLPHRGCHKSRVLESVARRLASKHEITPRLIQAIGQQGGDHKAMQPSEHQPP